LRNKIGKLFSTEQATPVGNKSAAVREEALLALTSLGYQRVAAEKAIRQVLFEMNGTSLSVEELIKSALRFSVSK
jgi:Holliday junction resolvasome RuvABC DNA-binding subunit